MASAEVCVCRRAAALRPDSLAHVSPEAPQYPCTYTFSLLVNTTIYPKQVKVLPSHNILPPTHHCSWAFPKDLSSSPMQSCTSVPCTQCFLLHPALQLCKRLLSHLNMLFYYSLLTSRLGFFALTLPSSVRLGANS